MTKIVTESLERYCEVAGDEPVSPADDLAELIGCAEGPADLSQTYKQAIGQSLSRKS